MRFLRMILIASAAVSNAAAGAIFDVSTAPSQQMNPGDTLYFLLSNLSLHTGVQTVEFVFASQSVHGSPQFEAELTSRDGAASASFGAVNIIAGYMTSSLYTGRVSAISAIITLPPSTSSAIWQDGRATLVLHDIGATVTLGLPGYTLRDDLSASLQSGNRTAGAVVNGVLYEDPPPGDAPENDSWLLVGGGLVIFSMSVRALKRSSRSRIQSS
jgi:hypothetical protein